MARDAGIARRSAGRAPARRRAAADRGPRQQRRDRPAGDGSERDPRAARLGGRLVSRRCRPACRSAFRQWPTWTATDGSTCWASIRPDVPVRAIVHGTEIVSLAGISAARRHGDRRSADQLVRHRRRDRGAIGPARAEAGHHVADRPLRPGRGGARGGRAHHLAQRRPAGGVRHARPTRRSGRRSASRVRARGCSRGTDARWRSSPTSSGGRRSACASTRRPRPTSLMTEDWVKIRGDQLAARDGAYDLRITAELWETHFFDLVSLLVVDHPADTRGLRGRAVRRAAADAAGDGDRTGAAVRVGHGRSRRRRQSDLAAAAGLTVRRFRRPRRRTRASRGRTSSSSSCQSPRRAPGRSGSSRRAGFIRPTARSTSRSARARTPPPKVCRCTSRTRPGAFTRSARGLGFPAGKDKTILIDLTGRLRRVRGRGASGSRPTSRSSGIGSAWAIGRPDVRVEPRRLELLSARTSLIAATR